MKDINFMKMNVLFWLLSVCLTLSISTAQAESPKVKLSLDGCSGSLMGCKAFQSETSFQKLKKRLVLLRGQSPVLFPEADRVVFEDAQKIWDQGSLIYCEFFAEFEARGSVGSKSSEAKKTSFRRTCFVQLLEERFSYLGRYEAPLPPAALGGVYDDGTGGTLQIQYLEKEKVSFHLEVVRGFSAHLGEYEGELEIKDGKAHFIRKKSDDDATCELKFEHKGRHIQVEEIDCSGFHGARAYFGGKYQKGRIKEDSPTP